MGTLLLFAGIGVLVLGGWALAAIGGLDEGQLTPTGWALVAIVGLAFVHTQVCAAVRLASVALASVTSVPRSTSVNQEEGNR